MLQIIPEVLFAFANNAEFLYDGYVVFGSLGLVRALPDIWVW